MRTKNLLFTGLMLGAVSALAATVSLPDAWAQDMPDGVRHGYRFVDEDGDGYNDNAPDADGDGIPNGRDEDYVRPGENARNLRGENASEIGRMQRNRVHAETNNGTGVSTRQRLRDGSGLGTAHNNVGALGGGRGMGNGAGK